MDIREQMIERHNLRIETLNKTLKLMNDGLIGTHGTDSTGQMVDTTQESIAQTKAEIESLQEANTLLKKLDF